jgi:hypothetical protein
MVVESHSYVFPFCGGVDGRLYVDFVFAISLLQRNSHGRIRLVDDAEDGGVAT